MSGKKALIAGATGLTGKELLQLLLEGGEYSEVIALVRRPLSFSHPKLAQVVCDFEQMEAVSSQLAANDVFCCLGTTIKKAKTKEAMYKIDVEYPVQLAKLARSEGADQYLVISSMNANPRSKIWYPKMKGQLEELLRAVPYDSLSILRPSLLLGEREEHRMMEQAATKLFGALSGMMRPEVRSRLAIEARTVALAMYCIAQKKQAGVTVYSSQDIEAAASR